MTRALDADLEERTEQRVRAYGRLLEYGIVEHFGRCDVRLDGLSVKFSGVDCLVTLRASVEGVPQVAFVGGQSLGRCLQKAVRDVNANTLNWRVDKFKVQ